MSDNKFPYRAFYSRTITGTVVGWDWQTPGNYERPLVKTTEYISKPEVDALLAEKDRQLEIAVLKERLSHIESEYCIHQEGGSCKYCSPIWEALRKLDGEKIKK